MLSGPRRAPAGGGPPRALVVLLHGLGADGADLIDLAGVLGPGLPHAAFVAPDAPEPCDMAPYGRQWFSLATRSAVALAAGVDRAAPVLDGFLDAELAAAGLAPGDLALVGFSQGTMTALHAGLLRRPPLAGIVGFSGLLAAPERLAAEAGRPLPPVLLVHGEADEVVSIDYLPAAERALAAAGVPLQVLRRPGLGHGIDEAGLATAAAFLAACLPRALAV